MKTILDRLRSMSTTNKQYNHMTHVPSLDDLEEFKNVSSNFFGLDSANRLEKTELMFTVKDIFNTYVFPTEMGSEIWKDFKAGNNARVISMALNAGHYFIGKTVTSEFAVHNPTKTINPWDPNRQVGTSSSGSAVSVLLEECDYSLCTQSGASISRPSSYLGIYGVKPTFGLVPRTGILKTCDNFDTVGFMTNDISNANEILSTISLTNNNHPKNNFIEDKDLKKCKVGYFDSEQIAQVVDSSSSMLSSYDRCISRLKEEGVNIEQISMPDFFHSIHLSHDIIYSKSLEYYFKNELKTMNEISDSFKEIIKQGSAWSPDRFKQERENQAASIKAFDNFIEKSNIDYILTPAVHGVAPMIGKQEYNDLSLIWTYLQCPCITIPLDKCTEQNLPLGMNLSAKRFNDVNLINFVVKYFNKRPYHFSTS